MRFTVFLFIFSYPIVVDLYAQSLKEFEDNPLLFFQNAIIKNLSNSEIESMLPDSDDVNDMNIHPLGSSSILQGFEWRVKDLQSFKDYNAVALGFKFLDTQNTYIADGNLRYPATVDIYVNCKLKYALEYTKARGIYVVKLYEEKTSPIYKYVCDDKSEEHQFQKKQTVMKYKNEMKETSQSSTVDIKSNETKKNKLRANFNIPVNPERNVEPGTKPTLHDSKLSKIIFSSNGVVHKRLGKRSGYDGVSRWTMTLTVQGFEIKTSKGVYKSFTILDIDYDEAFTAQKFELSENSGKHTHNLHLSWSKSGQHYYVILASIDKLEEYQFQETQANEKYRDEKEETVQKVTGDLMSFYNYIANNMKYPIEARKQRIEGKVIVSFNVELDGTLSHPKIVEGIGYGCDEEVLRVINAAPKLKGLVDGKVLNRVIPINFKLND